MAYEWAAASWCQHNRLPPTPTPTPTDCFDCQPQRPFHANAAPDPDCCCAVRNRHWTTTTAASVATRTHCWYCCCCCCFRLLQLRRPAVHLPTPSGVPFVRIAATPPNCFRSRAAPFDGCCCALLSWAGRISAQPSWRRTVELALLEDSLICG